MDAAIPVEIGSPSYKVCKEKNEIENENDCRIEKRKCDLNNEVIQIRKVDALPCQKIRFYSSD